ncbi:hypothetical protein C8Q77DRAFT_1076679 [Trametes polyzona]|nr:hypothetical protein C8Q77DRAFT_1076679 [Trametes polyzona]
MSSNSRTVRRKPRLSSVSRSTNLSTSSSITVAETARSSADVRASTSEKKAKPLPPPPKSLLFRFHQQGFNTMVLYAADSTAHYHVTVCMNCFIPSSFITVVRRQHERGEFVSSFEMGISTQRATVNVRGMEKPLDTILSRTGRKSDDRIWQWRWDDEPGHILGWHRDTPVRYCYALDKAGSPIGPIVAAFVVSPPAAEVREGPPHRPTLKIFPDGVHIMDHIVTSALVVERKRLTPSPMAMNSIFN